MSIMHESTCLILSVLKKLPNKVIEKLFIETLIFIQNTIKFFER